VLTLTLPPDNWRCIDYWLPELDRVRANDEGGWMLGGISSTRSTRTCLLRWRSWPSPPPLRVPRRPRPHPRSDLTSARNVL